MKILGYAYRSWARQILHSLNIEDIELYLEQDREQITEERVRNINPDLILFYGWSWRVPNWLIDKYVALCLHPSELPKYRGGSPIQNQILNGEEEGAVSIFRMTKDVDEGPLCAQVKLDLTGSMDDITKRIIKIGKHETFRIIHEHMNGGIKFWPQEGEITYCDRRIPEESEITLTEIQEKSALYLYDKIRCLQDPYPNAFITCGDGKKLYLTEAHVG